MLLSICVVILLGQRLVSWCIIETQDSDMSFLMLLNMSLTQSVINMCKMSGKFVKFTAEMFSECQNVGRVKRPAKTLMYACFIHLYAQSICSIYP